MNHPDARHYSYRVQWSPEDNEYVATVLEFPGLSRIESDQSEALNGVVRLVEGVIDDLIANDETVPRPFSERSYSGTIYVRTSPDLHRRLAIEAAERHVSLNQLAVQRLANA
ncbi:type II toxin-antitoxin system HicB family antitoxin [Rhodococcus ruber]|uniref:HicB n=1 Tax=Rhodococcus rhodochrous KG-21 TaxID=1441923 RepID=A0A0N0S0M6_RHORH|nr:MULTISPECIES: type II toxin-antitoxin system HicB family antitoxin [Rhodococcus]AXY52321.1 hypothetical protein YT1_2912 [Rhodococcus ruber]KOS55043.1 HicB [Rhodococcus rhodochrous KG-21]UQB70659.1 type II toxin-antitoxin system HicB family antitoxin [Rhodococcus ruber]WKK13448.1 toxin-antitoxin system HicB family antitoxin [Rhodococcus ruber]WML65306.1 toxin-antitoxin system HicB family antitoxin [Rhodococcus sp. AH-ZY2]